MKFTPSQQQVIDSRGNVVVLAGAGTGKTRTLVERTVRHVLNQDVSLDQLLMVTFTEAAAAEMRHRIRGRLEEELEEDGSNDRISEQLALLETANISTLHSFCLQLIRQHFHELGLDPQLTVLPEAQSKLLAAEVLDTMFEDAYADKIPEAGSVLEFLENQSQGWEKPVRELLMFLHDYTETRPDPKGWRDEQLSLLNQPQPDRWEAWLIDGYLRWRGMWMAALPDEPEESVVAHQCAQVLKSSVRRNTGKDQMMLFDSGDSDSTGTSGVPVPEIRPDRASIAQVLERIQELDQAWPSGTKKYRKSIESFFKDATFLASLVADSGKGGDPMVEDWDWMRSQMTTLLTLSQEFSDRFASAKREMGALDFHDLEQFALKLLWDPADNSPTPLALQWRERFKLVFVDEYQDINAAQDRILAAVSREGRQANRFLVGDVKQSIYRFRQAAPTIFQHYAATWTDDSKEGVTLPLSDNFRSHEQLLEFINRLFRSIMHSEVGGVEYDANAELKFGDADGRDALRKDEADDGLSARVECHFRLKPGGKEREASDALADLSDAEQEARILASRMRELYDEGHLIWDRDAGMQRPVSWSDMMVLLRSPRSKIESYAREFDRAGIPLEARRSGFFESVEVMDLVSLLNLLDNPLQDVPLLAVLRSPLVGLSLDELATIRLAEKKVRFWIALKTWYRRNKEDENSDVTYEKVDRFLTLFSRWRDLSRHASLAQRLEAIVSETHYGDWLLTLPRGDQRWANVQLLLTVARQFDEMHNQGLYRFLRYIEAQQEVAGDQEPAPLEAEDAVRLTSIHQSKGLEFPVVAVADLGKGFNFSDSSSGVLLDDEYGLCPQIRPPGAGTRYPSLPYWLARQHQKHENLGEELRLLYVALTRAQDTLILTGTTTLASAERKWTASDVGLPYQILKARSYLDWIGPWLSSDAGTTDWLDNDSGHGSLWRWNLYRTASAEAESSDEEPVSRITKASPEAVNDLKQRIEWRYPFQAACGEPAKTSVTLLRKRTAEQLQGESQPAPFARPSQWSEPASGKSGLTGAEIGTAHHQLMQLASLDQVGTFEGVEAEAKRLGESGVLSAEEVAALDIESVSAFWGSEVGRDFLNRQDDVRRELPFTLRIDREDLQKIGLPLYADMPDEDFLVAQGVVDLAMISEDEIWILDFKTDHLRDGKLDEKVALYGPQVKLYGHAMSVIYGKPVTRRWLHFLSTNKTVEV